MNHVDAPRYPPKPRPGDKVAIVSPSGGLPELFPLPYELGLRRLREEFGLIPVEFPTTRVLGSAPADRAADLHAAFADPEIKAVVCSIGGEDQITVLPHLDADLLRANPKPFFGYSDAMNLLTYLHALGIVGYHGGAIMTQYGRAGAMHPLTVDSLRAALFTSGPFELVENKEFGDVDVPWEDAVALEHEPPTTASAGWSWLCADRVGAVPGGPARGGGTGVRRVPPDRDAGVRPRDRTHRAAGRTPLRRPNPGGRTGPPHHGPVLSTEYRVSG